MKCPPSIAGLLFFSLTAFTGKAQPQTNQPNGPGYTAGPSKLFSGIQWIGEEIPYGDTAKKGDTFPLTWSGVHNIYTAAGDPLWGRKQGGLDVEVIAGNAPGYNIGKVNEMNGYSGWGGSGPKPTGLLCITHVPWTDLRRTRLYKLR